jgi:hypothetical protein
MKSGESRGAHTRETTPSSAPLFRSSANSFAKPSTLAAVAVDLGRAGLLPGAGLTATPNRVLRGTPSIDHFSGLRPALQLLDCVHDRPPNRSALNVASLNQLVSALGRAALVSRALRTRTFSRSD